MTAAAMPVSRGREAASSVLVDSAASEAPVSSAELVAGEPPEVVVASEPAVVEQLTALGTLTPWAAQICEAKWTAELWSSSSQAPGLARQQAMSPMKDSFSQMHLGSVPQSPMPPARN
jgi:hypothetical protein